MREANLGLDLTTKRTRKREFLDQMNRVVPWGELVALVLPPAPEGKRGRRPFPVETMLRIHFMQQWFTLSDPAMGEAFHDVPLFRDFAALDNWNMRLPDESTILRFSHLLEKHELAAQMLATVNAVLSRKGLLLKAGRAVDATLIAAPSLTKKGNQWYFGMTAHIGVDAEFRLVHAVQGTAANVHDIVKAEALLHGKETVVYGDAGYRGIQKRTNAKAVQWMVAMCPGERAALDKNDALDRIVNEIECLKASVRAKVEHPFRVIKLQFGVAKARYRGLKKNTAQLTTLFALSNLWMARRKLLKM
ncbi:IS5 family transposase [Caballeronia sp. SEWSISQ10-4 2]|uniref:IS5 family transposase n=1 Tax=Caballeronia sp. SEWSISQ10-4 2 TaxID=2937438 RepID=UPI002653BB1A|nr:IS5 family transposase [Caballeronia sp. SEWSISQ10-4 2]MDN7179164.1 IS5 family transposase [Caballeronia sp. SEWSISQ10-4 2]